MTKYFTVETTIKCPDCWYQQEKRGGDRMYVNEWGIKHKTENGITWPFARQG